jgi:polyhydroxyalkanoate synthesis regulator phasin
MIRLGGLVSQKAFGKFEMGKVISNPFATAFVNEAEGEDHEVSMGQNQLDTIIKMATELKAKMGENEKEIPAWIQDHISKAENYISQAAGNYHEYGTNESINEAFNVRDLPTWLFDDADDFEYWYEHGMTLGNGKGKIASFNSSDDKKLEALVKKWKDAEYDYQHGRGDLGTGKTTGARAVSYAAQDAIKQLFKQKGKIVKNESIKEASPCWKGYKQVGMKDKGGRQVPNCVPNESVVNEEPAKSTGEKIQNLNNRIKALKDKMAATKSSEQKNLIQQRLKNALQTLSNYKKQNISKESVVREASGRVPQIFLKTGAVEKKIKELMADRKKAVVPYNTEKDPTKKESLKQILIKLTKQIQGYEKNLVQLRDKEEEYIQQMQADAELDTSAFD